MSINVESLDALARAAQKKLGLKLRRRELLLTALTHSSYAKGQGAPAGSSYERLEFLGDAVLGLVVAEHLYQVFPDRDEGELTRLKSALVSEPTLARCARRAGLGEFLILDRGEEESGGRDRASILSDAFEAVIGAVFLDRGLRVAKAFVLHWLEPALTEICHEAKETNFKGLLQEMTQNLAKDTPEYVTVKQSGPEHDQTFVVEVYFRGELLGTGVGKTKRAAEQQAARQALGTLTERQAMSTRSSG